MRTSYIINSAALDPWVHGSNPHRQAGYRSRAQLLEEKVLPTALEQGFDEVIVAGVYKEGKGYRYVPVTPRHRDRRDALWQREIGARHSTGDVLVFGHDDHMLGKDFLMRLEDHRFDEWDLLVPQRRHGITGAVLNNGFEDGPQKASYCGGHVMVLKRWLWAEVPWTACNTEYWDTSQSRLWKEAGAKIVFADDLIHLDVEASADES